MVLRQPPPTADGRRPLREPIQAARVPWYWTFDVPFSHGWRAGQLVFVGGQVSMDQRGNVLGVGDIEEQTFNAMTNVQRVLEDAGASMRDLVKLLTFYVFDGPREQAIAVWERMTHVRAQFLTPPGPATTGIPVPVLGYPDLLVEIEAVAVLPDETASNDGESLSTPVEGHSHG